MIFPKFLKDNDTIGISAPSAGVGRKLEDFDRSLACLKSCNLNIKETEHVRVNDMRGGDALTRGQEFNSLVSDKGVDFIACAAGGDFLFECLPYIDFENVVKHPKWVMGSSDPTGILYPLTTKYDVATIYGANAGSFDIDEEFLRNNLKIIKGDLIEQKSFDKYMSEPGFNVDHIEYDKENIWQSNKEEIRESGRCIGGCIDVLKDLVGTEYDGTLDFIERYKEEGTIFYFDNYSLSSEMLYRTLLQFKYAGWFKYTKAVIIGRTLFEHSDTGMSYSEAIDLALNDIPYVMEADVGHTLPHMTLINGAIVNLGYKNGKGSLKFELNA